MRLTACYASFKTPIVCYADFNDAHSLLRRHSLRIWAFIRRQHIPPHRLVARSPRPPCSWCNLFQPAVRRPEYKSCRVKEAQPSLDLGVIYKFSGINEPWMLNVSRKACNKLKRIKPDENPGIWQHRVGGHSLAVRPSKLWTNLLCRLYSYHDGHTTPVGWSTDCNFRCE